MYTRCRSFICAQSGVKLRKMRQKARDQEATQYDLNHRFSLCDDCKVMGPVRIISGNATLFLELERNRWMDG